jgi:hypothetical protein
MSSSADASSTLVSTTSHHWLNYKTDSSSLSVNVVPMQLSWASSDRLLFHPSKNAFTLFDQFISKIELLVQFVPNQVSSEARHACLRWVTHDMFVAEATVVDESKAEATVRFLPRPNALIDSKAARAAIVPRPIRVPVYDAATAGGAGGSGSSSGSDFKVPAPASLMTMDAEEQAAPWYRLIVVPHHHPTFHLSIVHMESLVTLTRTLVQARKSLFALECKEALLSLECARENLNKRQVPLPVKMIGDKLSGAVGARAGSGGGGGGMSLGIDDASIMRLLNFGQDPLLDSDNDPSMPGCLTDSIDADHMAAAGGGFAAYGEQKRTGSATGNGFGGGSLKTMARQQQTAGAFNFRTYKPKPKQSAPMHVPSDREFWADIVSGRVCVEEPLEHGGDEAGEEGGDG